MKLLANFNIVIIILFFTFFNYTCAFSKEGILMKIIELQQQKGYLSEFSKKLLVFNLDRAYHYDSNLQRSPVKFFLGLFETSYYIPAESYLIKSSSKVQLSQFESEINALRLTLSKILFNKYDYFDEIGKILDVSFSTFEGKDLFTIGRYKKGKLFLVREKIN